jgi:hypothetical protein
MSRIWPIFGEQEQKAPSAFSDVGGDFALGLHAHGNYSGVFGIVGS